MNILISVHPEYATGIISGRKTLELRKTNIKHWKEGDLVFIYATAPVSKVIGYAVAYNCIKLAKWKLTHRSDLLKDMCLSEQQATDYLDGHKIAYLYRLTRPVQFDRMLEIDNVPQSFRYVSDVESSILIFRGLNPVPVDYVTGGLI